MRRDGMYSRACRVVQGGRLARGGPRGACPRQPVRVSMVASLFCSVEVKIAGDRSHRMGYRTCAGLQRGGSAPAG
jgi:hypothetical protein